MVGFMATVWASVQIQGNGGMPNTSPPPHPPRGTPAAPGTDLCKGYSLTAPAVYTPQTTRIGTGMYVLFLFHTTLYWAHSIPHGTDHQDRYRYKVFYGDSGEEERTERQSHLTESP